MLHGNKKTAADKRKHGKEEKTAAAKHEYGKAEKTAAASLTAETALVMPIVLTALLFFVYLLQILYVEQELHMAAIRAARDASACGYLLKHADSKLEGLQKAEGEYYEVAELAGEVLQGVGNSFWLASMVKSRVTDLQSVDMTIRGGYGGISFWGSDVYAEDEMTVIRMAYKIEFPLFRNLIPAISFQKTIVMRCFSGEGELEEDAEEDGKEEEGYVYVTETGTVYHIRINCTYIKLSVKSENIGKIKDLRNKYGGKYYPCEACAKNKEGSSLIWITETGTHYHYQRDCSKIKRNVKKIPISEADKYRPCSRCAANTEKKD